MVTTCPRLPRTSSVYTCRPRVIMEATPFHSQEDPGLDKELCGHRVDGESCKLGSSEEKMKLEKGGTLWGDFGGRCGFHK